MNRGRKTGYLHSVVESLILSCWPATPPVGSLRQVIRTPVEPSGSTSVADVDVRLVSYS
jgi:hypothetical protein